MKEAIDEVRADEPCAACDADSLVGVRAAEARVNIFGPEFHRSVDSNPIRDGDIGQTHLRENFPRER